MIHGVLITDLTFGSWPYHIENENKTYGTSYSVTDETYTQMSGSFISESEVNVSALSKVKVTTYINSYDSIWLYLVDAVLKIRSEDFESPVEQSDDAVNDAALEFFGSGYRKNLNKENDKWQTTIDTYYGKIVLTKFPLVNKFTRFDHKHDIGKVEPL